MSSQCVHLCLVETVYIKTSLFLKMFKATKTLVEGSDILLVFGRLALSLSVSSDDESKKVCKDCSNQDPNLALKPKTGNYIFANTALFTQQPKPN